MELLKLNHRLKAAIIGPGYIGAVHAESLRRLGIEVAAIVGRTEASAEIRKAAVGAAIATTSVEEVLANPDIDVIHICSPNNKHYEQAKAALLAGKHVVCEKPITLSSEESRDLLEISRKTNKVFAVCYCYRYYPLLEQMKEMIEQGEIGTPALIHGTYLADELMYPTDYAWRISPEIGGPSIAMADVGVHWCDLAEYVTNQKIVEVFAEFQTVIPKRTWRPNAPGAGPVPQNSRLVENSDSREVEVQGEDTLSLLIRFENGTRGNVIVSQVSPGNKNRIEVKVEGTEAGLEWNQEQPNTVLVRRRNSHQVLLKDSSNMTERAAGLAKYPAGHPEGYPDAFRNMMADFYTDIDRVKSGGQPSGNYPRLLNGHRGMLFVEAALESVRTGTWAKVAAE